MKDEESYEVICHASPPTRCFPNWSYASLGNFDTPIEDAKGDVTRKVMYAGSWPVWGDLYWYLEVPSDESRWLEMRSVVAPVSVPIADAYAVVADLGARRHRAPEVVFGSHQC